MAGSAFRSAGFDLRSLTPTGICDIAPTILHVLGLSPPGTMSGRILLETLVDSDADGEHGTPHPDVFETGTGAFRQTLRRSRVGSCCYLDGGWVGSEAVDAARTA